MKFFISFLIIILIQGSAVKPTEHNSFNKNQSLTKHKKMKNPKKIESLFLIPQAREDAGMFSMFDDVLDALNRYEMGLCSGLEINFEKNGLYYDAGHGDNWWNYYCEAINLREKKAHKKMKIKLTTKILNETKEMLISDRKKVNWFITKYIHIKQHIQDKINAFEQKHFTGRFVLSVHHRGTDKYTEAPPVSYQEISYAIANVLKRKAKGRVATIFIASDEQDFINYMKQRFGKAICYNEEAFRSADGTPIHSDVRLDRYKCGEDALIDCILLSKGDFLIRCSSNLSRWSTYFNPTIPVLLLNTQFNWLHQIQNTYKNPKIF